MLQAGERASLFKFQPISGLPVDMARQTTVLVFLRPVTGSQARVAVARLQEAWPRFDAAGIPIVALTRCDLEFARDFVPRYHVLFPMVCDEAGEYFEAYGVGRDKGFLGTLKSMGPAALRRIGDGLNLGRTSSLPSDQLPACFVVARDGTVRYARYATSVLEQPDLEAMWAASS